MTKPMALRSCWRSRFCEVVNGEAEQMAYLTGLIRQRQYHYLTFINAYR